MPRILFLVCFPVLLLNAQEPTRVFMQRCQQCHSPNSGAHAPLPEDMASIPWEDILKSLETGNMKAQGASLSPDERKAVARYLGKPGPVVLPVMGGHCAAGAKPVPGSAWNGWGVDDWNTPLPTGRRRRVERRHGGQAAIEMGLRISQPAPRPSASQPSWTAACLPAATTARCMRSTRAAGASTGCTRRRRWFARQWWWGPVRGPISATWNRISTPWMPTPAS